MRTLKVSFMVAVIAAALSPLAKAQHHCSTLSVEGTGNPGTHLTFALSHADPLAPAAIFIADHPGHTVLTFGSLGSLTLGLSQPFLTVAMGITNEHGQASLVANVPLHLPGLALNAQATSVRVTHEHPPLRFCPSNVVPFHVGGHL
jgi:hypothetical protein